ncbi:DUF6913 domain-containing protein [Cardinium endosymbiont of Sogatella furcifera]|uniref:DUF6913 domain-containing protein n=1 Tax=Cardinium endosymbiont of Sogatella furcifera TaxID=650378 RepID=UPI000E0D226A|nr:hypothetical protein [Cardinium endosymbiont of Sogatella furcifera]
MMGLYLSFKFFVLGIVTRCLAKHKTLVRSNVGLSRATTIGVLYSYDSPAKHEVVQRFIRDLKNLDKNVSVLCYTTGKDRVHPSSHLRYAFSHHAITILGKVKGDRIKKFIETPFDYLFQLDLTTNSVLDCLVAKQRAKCRVGHFDPMRKNLFEVMVKVSRTVPIEDTKRLASQMLHYTGCMEG